MRRKDLLNRFHFAIVVLWSTILYLPCASVLAQQTEPAEEEQEVDLDALDEELGEQSEGKTESAEKLLPMNTEMVEIDRNPALALIAFTVLIPLSTLLLPLERTRKGGRTRSRQNRKTKNSF